MAKIPRLHCTTSENTSRYVRPAYTAQPRRIPQGTYAPLTLHNLEEYLKVRTPRLHCTTSKNTSRYVRPAYTAQPRRIPQGTYAPLTLHNLEEYLKVRTPRLHCTTSKNTSRYGFVRQHFVVGLSSQSTNKVALETVKSHRHWHSDDFKLRIH